MFTFTGADAGMHIHQGCSVDKGPHLLSFGRLSHTHSVCVCVCICVIYSIVHFVEQWDHSLAPSPAPLYFRRGRRTKAIREDKDKSFLDEVF